MASDLESAAKRGMEKGEAEDVIQVLMETLVDPRLPSRASGGDPPSEEAHKSVAKQMHAVVLLYHFYHRTQTPELKFLDFASFCKLALLLRPTLISFMKATNKAETMKLNSQLSVTEKAIKDACDIAMALGTAKDVSIAEGWPISKVVVLLVDPTKKNCLLQFGAITEGVWSLIEKELDDSYIDQEIVAEEGVGYKRKRNNQNASAYDSKFLQLGYDAVKDVTGIDSCDLVVLESRVAYSLSEVKSAARFYMMQCPQSISNRQSVPLKFLAESLQGPLMEKYGDAWTTTTVVEYYHMLPYVGFISSWLSSLNETKVLDHIDNGSSEMEVSLSRKIGNVKNQKKVKHSSDIFECAVKDGNATDDFKKRSHTLSSVIKETSRTTFECLDSDRDIRERGLNSGPSKVSTSDGMRQRLHSNIIVYKHHRKKNVSSVQHNACGPVDHVNIKVDDMLCRDEKVRCNQTEIEVKDVEASEELQNALALLYRKRLELWSQISDKEDTLALCEANIERIRDGGEIDLARQCIKSIMSGNNQWLAKSKRLCQDKQTTFIIPGDNSCQDLEYICFRNNWRLPRYFVQPSDGKFVSNVAVESKNVKLSSKGSYESSPCEARESAAAQIIAKIRTEYLSVFKAE